MTSQFIPVVVHAVHFRERNWNSKNVELSDQNNTWNDRFNFASDTIQYETPPQSHFTNKCYQYNKDNSMKGI